MEMVYFEVLLGKTFSGVELGDNYIEFHCTDGSIYTMCHKQDCCERVYIEDIVGDVNDLIDSPILLAEESSSDDPNASESGTWTFYKLATFKGYVDIRWYGSSNGYYSESVYLYQVL